MQAPFNKNLGRVRGWVKPRRCNLSRPRDGEIERRAKRSNVERVHLLLRICIRNLALMPKRHFTSPGRNAEARATMW
jgi:hypothetical protein